MDETKIDFEDIDVFADGNGVNFIFETLNKNYYKGNQICPLFAWEPILLKFLKIYLFMREREKARAQARGAE